jgi:hypothetical protein
VSVRAAVAACALAAALGGWSISMATDQQAPEARERELGRFMLEQLRVYQKARGGTYGPALPDADRFRVQVFDGKTLIGRARGTATKQPALSTADRMLQQSIVRTYQNMLVPSISCCNCTTSSTCNDGLFCNGAEICSSGTCATGTTSCVDGNPCTNDSCNEITDTCVYSPVPPPAEVAQLNLGRAAPASPVATLAWSAVTGASTYNIYRAAFSNLGGLSCFQTGITGTTQNDDGALPAGAFYYLVSSLACGESGLGPGNPNSRPPAPGCP